MYAGNGPVIILQIYGLHIFTIVTTLHCWGNTPHSHRFSDDFYYLMKTFRKRDSFRHDG